MKLPVNLLACVLVTAFVGPAFAQTTCPAGSTRIAGTGNALQTFLRGKTVCAVRGADRWQEYHSANGDLIDYKLGPGHPVDPTETVGTWSASNGDAATVTYTYGASSYSWAVCQIGATYTFQGTGGTITGATFTDGQVACGGAAALSAPGSANRRR